MDGACERARRYANSLLGLLEEIEEALGNRKAGEFASLLDAARRYARDTFYFIGKGDCETALVSASYAEGLLDALRYMGALQLEWPSSAGRDLERKVFLAGTFDLIHPGHIDLMEYASRYGKLYVVIARDINVKRSKGKRPLLSERSRLRVVQAIRYVYEAVLGDEKDIFRPLRDIKPDIVVLGPDQPFDPKELSKKLSSMLGKEVKVFRYEEKREFEPGMKGSSDIIRRVCCESYCQSIGCTLGRGELERSCS